MRIQTMVERLQIKNLWLWINDEVRLLLINGINRDVALAMTEKKILRRFIV